MTAECEPPAIEWAYRVLGICTDSARLVAGDLLGLLSILCWVIALFPQLWKNFQNKAVEGISHMFIIIWALGDFSNFIGAIAADQLPFQQVVSGFYVFVDIAMLSQFALYNKRKRDLCGDLCVFGGDGSGDTLFPPRRRNNIDEYESSEGIEQYSIVSTPTGRRSSYVYAPLSVAVCISIISLCIALGSGMVPGSSAVETNVYAHPIPAVLQRTVHAFGAETADDGRHDARFVAGYVLGWVSGVTYVVSRIPQLRKTLRERSVEGLSPLLFIFSVLGNLTYGLSIFMNDTGSDTYMMDHLPWLVGSLGTLGFDVVLLVLTLKYDQQDAELSVFCIDESDIVED